MTNFFFKTGAQYNNYLPNQGTQVNDQPGFDWGAFGSRIYNGLLAGANSILSNHNYNMGNTGYSSSHQLLPGVDNSNYQPPRSSYINYDSTPAMPRNQSAVDSQTYGTDYSFDPVKYAKSIENFPTYPWKNQQPTSITDQMLTQNRLNNLGKRPPDLNLNNLYPYYANSKDSLGDYHKTWGPDLNLKSLFPYYYHSNDAKYDNNNDSGDQIKLPRVNVSDFKEKVQVMPQNPYAGWDSLGNAVKKMTGQASGFYQGGIAAYGGFGDDGYASKPDLTPRGMDYSGNPAQLEIAKQQVNQNLADAARAADNVHWFGGGYDPAMAAGSSLHQMMAAPLDIAELSAHLHPYTPYGAAESYYTKIKVVLGNYSGQAWSK